MRKRTIRFGAPPQKSKSTQNYDEPVKVNALALDGRGVARGLGKTLFIEGALPGETVRVKLIKSHKRYDEAQLTEVITPSAQRVTPPCRYYGACGGCDLQHLAPEEALELKQAELLNQLTRFAGLTPVQIDPPLRSEQTLGYRRAARIGINQRDSGELLIGFRRAGSRLLIDIDQCAVLTPGINQFIEALRAVLSSEARVKHLTQLEISNGDTGVCAELRSTKALSAPLRARLIELAREQQAQLSVNLGEGQRELLYIPEQPAQYRVADDLDLRFEASDFLQVNRQVNLKMIEQVLDWLDPQPEDRVLDLFAGLGNFSLPLAKRVSEVVSVEGSAAMVERCRLNAQLNGLSNVTALVADLSQESLPPTLTQQAFSLVVLDPPRAGAESMVKWMDTLNPRALVYIACDAAALVRDAKTLGALGYRLERLCIADMFPQTHHIESLALFVRG